MARTRRRSHHTVHPLDPPYPLDRICEARISVGNCSRAKAGRLPSSPSARVLDRWFPLEASTTR